MQIKTLISGLIIVAALSSCDKVKNPKVQKDEVQGTNFITKSNDSVSNYKKVLVEDYTGHQCGNCPNAAIVAENLYAQYHGTVVVIAVHAGFWTKTNAEYPTSYTTSAGNDWDNKTSGFGISFIGNPNGMVNRKNFPGEGLVQKETKWPSSVSVSLQETMTVELKLTTNYDPGVRALNTDIKGIFKTNYGNATKISVVLIEDSIIGPQKDYSKIPDKVPNYKFEHMLRGAINGSWGADFKAGAASANDTVRVTYNNFPIDSKFNDRQITVVAFVYDASSREVLQVEKVKIR